MPGPRIEIEEDPTPLALALRCELARRLDDPEFAALTDGLSGTAALRCAATPEAVTFSLGDPIEVRHGAAAAATATLDERGRWDGGPIEGEGEHAELAAWLRALATPDERPWREAAARLWSALETTPGAPAGLLVVNLESGEREQFGDPEAAYEIHGEPGPLIALLEGRTPLIDEAFARRVYIRGSFPDISTVTGAALRVRLGDPSIDA